MKRFAIALLVLTACGGDLPPRTRFEAASPQAPEATFDPGVSPFGSSAPPPASSATHDHAHMHGPMPAGSSR